MEGQGFECKGQRLGRVRDQDNLLGRVSNNP